MSKVFYLKIPSGQMRGLLGMRDLLRAITTKQQRQQRRSEALQLTAEDVLDTVMLLICVIGCNENLMHPS